MEIRLHNVGIVGDSTMSLDGLTIITGDNNSGKTTVGKAIYSLVDAVSDISAKAKNDRRLYIMKKLDEVCDELKFLHFLLPMFEIEGQSMGESIISEYFYVQSLISHDYRNEMTLLEFEEFAQKLKDELTIIDVDKLCKEKKLQHFFRGFIKSKEDISKILREKIDKSNDILTELFSNLKKDPQLIDYTRESINQTLNLEFCGQIQPAGRLVDESAIEIYNNDNTCCFKINIKDNMVVNDGKPVFFSSPYKKTFLIDNPFIFDESINTRRYMRLAHNSNTESVLNLNNIISHNIKLKLLLRKGKHTSVLEQMIINESLEKVKNKIDSILSGSFEFSVNGDYYLQDGMKLKMSNLATGSKMFSIIKILLEKGELGRDTMLILDEPEAHLHPSWQNRFAEIIVLLVKELDVNILLTTHSSNFVLALDAYMRKYSIEDKTNFYRTVFNATSTVDYICMNNDIGYIYQDFLKYLSEVKVLRNKCLRDTGDDL